MPFVYSIATFAALRSYEFIRNGPVLHDLPVRIVGVGPGLDYGPNGITHWALEDVAVLRPLPGLAVIAPADDAQTASAVRGDGRHRRARPTCGSRAWDRRSPASTAASRSAARTCSATAPTSRSSRSATWPSTAVEAQGAARRRAASARASWSSRASGPRRRTTSSQALAGVPLALSVESHYVDGGVGSLTAEVVAENGLATRLVRAGVRRSPVGETGSAEFLHARHGLSAGALASTALDHLARRPLPLRRPA